MKLDSLISQIKKDKMNEICFDCGAEKPIFISINNGIFLCDQCATVHMSFPQGISIIENNDLYSLSENELKYLSLGGNTRLNDFILDEFPKLENYSQKLLYKTRGMDYYRKRLDYFVNGGVEPRRPSQIVGCQLVPDNYNQNNIKRRAPQKYEPKTRTFKPEEQIKSRKFNLNQKNNDNDDEEELFRDPFMNEGKFGVDEGKMFKKLFGNDFFGDDDFFGSGKDKMSQTQNKTKPSYYQEKPKVFYNNNKEPQDNILKKPNPQFKVQQRPLTASNPIFVPSRKHKYIKKEEQNNNNSTYSNKDNNNNNNYNNNYNRNSNISNRNNKNTYTNKDNNNNSNYNNNYNRNSINSNRNNNINNNNINNNNINNNYNRINNERPINNRGDKYNPFKRRDSTELITLPGSENNNLVNNERKQKNSEISQEFRNRASRLGQISDSIRENDEDTQSENEEEYSAELDKIPENNTHKVNPNDKNDDDQITFKNSIRNKYKKKKSGQIMDNNQNEVKLRNSKPNIENQKDNINKNTRRGSELNSNTNKDNSNIDKKYARRLSKIHLTSTNWNINQLGDINIYPDAMEVEE